MAMTNEVSEEVINAFTQELFLMERKLQGMAEVTRSWKRTEVELFKRKGITSARSVAHYINEIQDRLNGGV